MAEAIDSALGQTYKNIEVIVVNDGSTDKNATEKVALSYGEKIRYLKKPNGGVATALNFGIEKMTGAYFSWLSHDDIYEKTKIEDQVSWLSKFGSNDVIIASNVKVLFANGIKKKERIDKNTFAFIDVFLATSAYVGLNGCSLLIPKRAFESCGVFNQNLLLTQDYDLWFRMKDKFSFELLDKFLVISRRHDEQGSVMMKEKLIKAGDDLHSSFMENIPYSRFKDYFENNKQNLKNIYENYTIFKTRGYKKTPSMILKNILRYYHEKDIDKFYQVFSSEIDMRLTMSKSDSNQNDLNTKRKHINYNRETIEREYGKLLRSDKKEYPLLIQVVARRPQPKSRLVSATRSMRDSINRDGVYLTGEKIARRAYTKAKRNR